MDTVQFPVVVRSHHSFVQALAEEECGSWEDHGRPEPGTLIDGKEHAYNILTRHRSKFEFRNLAEIRHVERWVLDNSIDKANSNVDEYRLDPREYARACRWRRQLVALQAKLRAIRARVEVAA